MEEHWLAQFGIPVSQAGFERLRTFIEPLDVPSEEVLIGVEATGQ